jgi:hypothetical protein
MMFEFRLAALLVCKEIVGSSFIRNPTQAWMQLFVRSAKYTPEIRVSRRKQMSQYFKIVLLRILMMLVPIPSFVQEGD